MLKIEVIKFEAMDVITASIAAPEEDKPVECICPKNADHYDERTKTWDHGNCQAERHPNCISNVN